MVIDQKDSVETINTPDQVLYGTDIKKLDYFKAVPSNILGAYENETGGATIQLIFRDTSEGIELQRTYTEPGMQPQVKTYKPIKIVDAKFHLPEIDGIQVQDGILIFEHDSEAFGIPDDMWIFYTKKSTK